LYQFGISFMQHRRYAYFKDFYQSDTLVTEAKL